MHLFLSLAGLALIAVALLDVFQQLVHPNGIGRLNNYLVRSVWSLFRRLAVRRPSLLRIAGPVAFIVVVFGWGAMLAIGWALVYWPHLPDSFLLADGLDPSMNDGFLDALYLSLVSLGTLGYGEIAPKTTGMRLLTSAEALIGFSLFSAGIAWLLSLYPALSRQRTLAHSIWLLDEAQEKNRERLAGIDSSVSASLLFTLAFQVAAVRTDFVQFSMTYYFQTTNRRGALPVALPVLLRLAKQGELSPSAELRLASRTLRKSIEELADVLGNDFLRVPSDSSDAVLELYARDHLHEPGRSAAGGIP